ncbi:hypothetical protein [Acinetobacter sp. ANC 3813]|uniref:hypothetical protein n=1 Tax=Acinetobacter sp. ANC 3813 TaxID=1977873 RepID=UPI000A337D01|nr:hypothetical protein [Acinetobacter sp. ANC 3813]OTG87925.1 hypothetical protein B9T34_16460 [Acinetobacter sp. ANC 3813]
MEVLELKKESIAVKYTLNYSAISTFEDLKIDIQNAKEYAEIVRLLLALGYAWNDDRNTLNELYYGRVPEFIYVCRDACIYFASPSNYSFKAVGILYIRSLYTNKLSLQKAG